MAKKDARIFWVDINRFDVKPDKSTWLEVSEELINQGFQVSILTSYAKHRYQPAGKKVNIEYFQAVEVGGLFRYSLLLKIFFWLLRNSRSTDIIIIPPGGLYLAPLLKIFGKKRLHLDIRTVPVDVHTMRDKLDRILFWKLPIKFLRKNIKGFSFITDRLRKSVEAELNTQFNDFVIWQSGVNNHLFKPERAGNQLHDQAEKPFQLFYHGTVTENRGVGLVIEAVAALDEKYAKNIVLVIVGHGKGYDVLVNLVKEKKLQDRVEFKGLLPYENIPHEIVKADCCICPLPNFPEWNVSSPIKIFEYMACGKPIILTPIPAHLDVIKDSDFIVWTEGDEIKDFQLAIQEAYDNRERITQAAMQAPQLVESKFSWKIQGKKLSEYFVNRFEDKV